MSPLGWRKTNDWGGGGLQDLEASLVRGRVPTSTWADGGAGERGGGPVGGESPCDPEPVDTEGSDSPTR